MKKILCLMVVLVSLSGCAIFMPYNESFICTVPEGQGYCGSLSDGYEYSTNIGR